MLRAWLLTLDILIRIGLLKLPQQEQPEKLNERDCDQDTEQPHNNCNEDTGD